MSDEDEVIKKAPLGLEDDFGGGDEILDMFDDTLSSNEEYYEDIPIGGDDEDGY